MHTQDEPLGTAHRDPGGRWVLRFERSFPHPPQKVWRALTEAEHLRSWFPVDLVGERRAGAALTLPFWPEVVERYGDRIGETVTHGEIKVWEPVSVLEWTWAGDVLRWELSAQDGGTHLTFTTWLGDPDVDVTDPAAGYHDCLHRLQQVLGGGTPSWPAEEEITRVQERYATALGTPAATPRGQS